MIYYLNLDVVFKRKLDLIHEETGKIEKTKVTGFLQEIGCTAQSDSEMKELVMAVVLQDYDLENLIVNFDCVGVIDPKDIQKEIFDDGDIGDALIGDPLKNGIWYKTGHGFYTE